MSYDNTVDAITDKTLTATYGFWSAMLTAHTVLLSVAVALPSIGLGIDSWKFKVAAICATLSVVALIVNFGLMRFQYEAIGRRLLDVENSLTPEQEAMDLQRAIRTRLVMRLFEVGGAAMLMGEAILFSCALMDRPT